MGCLMRKRKFGMGAQQRLPIGYGETGHERPAILLFPRHRLHKPTHLRQGLPRHRNLGVEQ
jgi:hypothetical protein